MKKVKYSHEVPFCLLERNLEWSSYQYCLPHLMEENEQYKNFFLRCVDEGVEIYLDNSLHELGESVSDELLTKWVDKLKPTTFFIPDAWEDIFTSIENAKRWKDIYVPAQTTKTAVVQAKSLSEAILCVNKYKELGYNKIAFSYGASYYNDMCPHDNKDFGKAIGRYLALKTMYEQGILTDSDRVHLLGTSWPAEFSMYSEFPFIESIDTSNPVMAGIEGLKYNNLGLDKKPKANMNSFQDIDVNFVDIKLIEYNLNKFREINKL